MGLPHHRGSATVPHRVSAPSRRLAPATCEHRSLADIAVTVQGSGEAYVALVVGAAPEVRDSVALDALEAADAIPALDGLVLDFDHYGRVVGLGITGAVDSILSASHMRRRAPVCR